MNMTDRDQFFKTARSAVFPVTKLTACIVPCDVPRFGLVQGEHLLFQMQDHWNCDAVYLSLDGELMMLTMATKSSNRLVTWPDGTTEDLPRRDADNMIAGRLKRRGVVTAEPAMAGMEWRAV